MPSLLGMQLTDGHHEAEPLISRQLAQLLSSSLFLRSPHLNAVFLTTFGPW